MKEKKENVHDLKLKMCKSLLFKGEGRVHMSISLERPVFLINFSVASMIILFIRTVNSR